MPPGVGRRALWEFAAQEFFERSRRHADPYIKLAKESVHRADFVEAHLVDQLLEDERIVREKIDSPFPIVEADGAGDDLPHFAGIAAANQAMVVHLARTLFDGELVPIFFLATTTV